MPSCHDRSRVQPLRDEPLVRRHHRSRFQPLLRSTTGSPPPSVAGPAPSAMNHWLAATVTCRGGGRSRLPPSIRDESLGRPRRRPGRLLRRAPPPPPAERPRRCRRAPGRRPPPPRAVGPLRAVDTCPAPSISPCGVDGRSHRPRTDLSTAPRRGRGRARTRAGTRTRTRTRARTRARAGARAGTRARTRTRARARARPGPGEGAGRARTRAGRGPARRYQRWCTWKRIDSS